MNNLILITNPPISNNRSQLSWTCPDGTHCFEASSQSSLNWKYEVSLAVLWQLSVAPPLTRGSHLCPARLVSAVNKLLSTYFCIWLDCNWAQTKARSQHCNSLAHRCGVSSNTSSGSAQHLPKYHIQNAGYETGYKVTFKYTAVCSVLKPSNYLYFMIKSV